MNVERNVIKKVSHVAAGLMLLASLNLPRLAHADAHLSDVKPLYTSGQEFVDASSQKEIEPVVIDVDVLMYHEVTAARLKNDFMDLINQGYQPISLETFVAAQRGEIEIPKGLKVFLPTFDDGLLSQYQAIIEATEYVHEKTGWFIPTEINTLTKFEDLGVSVDQMPGNTPSYNDGVHKYMTRDQLVDLIRRGHNVQPHTVNHSSLTSLSPGARNAEIFYSDLAVQSLWDMAGMERKVKALAFPNGRYDSKILQAIEVMGFDAAFTTVKKTRHSSKTPFENGRLSKS